MRGTHFEFVVPDPISPVIEREISLLEVEPAETID